MFSSRSGFSIILALGTVGFLMVLVSGIVMLFIREGKINNSIYQWTAAYVATEGMYEYAMLKVKNHREWYSDSVDMTDTEANILAGSGSSRLRNLKIWYEMVRSGTSMTGTVSAGQHIIFPLFVGTGSIYVGTKSMSPVVYTGVAKTQHLQVSAWDMQWHIVASDASGQTIGIGGTGDISGTKEGIIKTLHCDQLYTVPTAVDTEEVLSKECNDTSIPTNAVKLEQTQYFTLETKKVGDFMGSGWLDNFYFVGYAPTSSIAYTISADTPFTYPRTYMYIHARIGSGIVQNLQYTEDTSALYEALKYSIK